MRTLFIASLAIASLAGSAAARAPVQVTRFHLDRPLTGGSIVPAPFSTVPDGMPASASDRYDEAVARELARAGYVAGGSADAQFIYSTRVTRDSRDNGPSRSPITIGIGGGVGSGGFGGGGGVGLGGSFGIGGKRSNIVTITRLSVSIVERGGSAVWEGRAETETPANKSIDADIAARLAAALFKGFPGESGRTISVR